MRTYRNIYGNNGNNGNIYGNGIFMYKKLSSPGSRRCLANKGRDSRGLGARDMGTRYFFANDINRREIIFNIHLRCALRRVRS